MQESSRKIRFTIQQCLSDAIHSRKPTKNCTIHFMQLAVTYSIAIQISSLGYQSQSLNFHKLASEKGSGDKSDY